MSFFTLFPRRVNFPIEYVNNETKETYTRLVSFQDLYRHAAISTPELEENVYYNTVRILDGERPDHLSRRLYDNPNFYWTFFIINPKLRMGESSQWPIPQKHIQERIKNSPFQKTVTHLNPLHTEEDNLLNRNFEIGEQVIGSKTGFYSTIKAIRHEYGQIILSEIKEHEDFPDNYRLMYRTDEEIVGQTSGESISVDRCETFIDSVYKYYDSIEGREINNPNFIEPSPIQQNIGINYVTFRQHFMRKNDVLSVVKVIRKDSILAFVEAFREVLKNG